VYNRGVKFSWDEDKAAAVKKEHHVEFAKIIDVFSDPYAVEFVDEAHSTEEETRYAIIGLDGPIRTRLSGLHARRAGVRRCGVAFHHGATRREVDG
jgi:uncharacterized protein